MRRFCASLFVLTCSLALIPVAQAQTGKGSIAGRVTDSSSGALIGAQVTVQPGGVSVISDTRGQFFINDLEPGNYTVTITYVGFEAFTQTLNVAAGQAANVDAKLGVESQNLKVLVSAERASGEAEAVNRELTADNIVQVLPSEVIRSLPNANIASSDPSIGVPRRPQRVRVWSLKTPAGGCTSIPASRPAKVISPEEFPGGTKAGVSFKPPVGHEPDVIGKSPRAGPPPAGVGAAAVVADLTWT